MRTSKEKPGRTKAASSARPAPARTGAASEELDPRFAQVIAAFARERGVTTGKMMASVGLKVNGKIFAMLVRGKLVAKLPKASVDALVRAGEGAYFDPRRDGRLMKEWVELRGTEPSWLEVAREAHRFVKGRA
jgi:TfoX/Sxy family transcriptional regulator of competence genes